MSSWQVAQHSPSRMMGWEQPALGAGHRMSSQTTVPLKQREGVRLGCRLFLTRATAHLLQEHIWHF